MSEGGRCVRLTTLPPSCAVVMKSGNFNFLEPSGPLQPCNGTALPLLVDLEGPNLLSTGFVMHQSRCSEKAIRNFFHVTSNTFSVLRYNIKHI